MKTMKNLLLILILFALSTTNLYAQKTKVTEPLNKNYTGLSFSGGWGRTFGFVGDMELRYGRYIQPHWLVGAAVDIQRNDRFKQQSLGLFARHYFNKTQNGFFLEGSYKFGIAQRSVIDPFTTGELEVSSGAMTNSFIGAGYALVNKKNFGMEFFAGWGATKYNFSRASTTYLNDLFDHGLSTGIRLQYQFK